MLDKHQDEANQAITKGLLEESPTTGKASSSCPAVASLLLPPSVSGWATAAEAMPVGPASGCCSASLSFLLPSGSARTLCFPNTAGCQIMLLAKL